MNVFHTIRNRLTAKIKFFLNLFYYFQYKRLINNMFEIHKDNNLKYLYEKEEETYWRKSFLKLILNDKNSVEILKAFTNNQIDLIKAKYPKENNPILISVVNNEMVRIQKLFDHYRSMGIQNFVILDNNSTDGTKEWLCKQTDCEVYSTEETYTTQKREAWINRLISYYGFNRWYLVVDSDEHFVYQDMETNDINHFISQIKLKGYKRVRSLMLDMYPKSNVFSQTELDRNNDFISKYSYFDKNTYTIKKESFGLIVQGGPRKRIFNLNVYLTKHPLFYFQHGDIQAHSHYQYPYKKNKDLPCFSALLHYKFLDSDISKYKERVKAGSFYNGSEEYRNYLNLFNNNESVNFFYEGSVKYENSNSLKEIKLLQKI